MLWVPVWGWDIWNFWELVQILFVGLFGMFGMCYVSFFEYTWFSNSNVYCAVWWFTHTQGGACELLSIIINMVIQQLLLQMCFTYILGFDCNHGWFIILILLILIIFILNPRSGRTSPTRRVLLGPKTVEDDMIWSCMRSCMLCVFLFRVCVLSWRFEVWGFLFPFVGCHELHSLKRI